MSTCNKERLTEPMYRYQLTLSGPERDTLKTVLGAALTGARAPLNSMESARLYDILGALANPGGDQ